MPIFIDPSGRSTFGIGICARCSRKMSLDDLFDDPNSPGLKVCIDDMDEFDPYRLPPRETEMITLPFTRPDTPIDGTVTNIMNLWDIWTEDGYMLTTELGQPLLLEAAP